MPAARRLKVDHTTVSRRITKLEKNLAVKLFERKTDGFVLTDEGHELLAIAEKIEALSRTISETVSHTPAQPVGRVRLTNMEGIAAFHLAEKRIDFNVLHKDIVVELVTERHLINLTRREADISISFVPPVGPKLNVRNAGRFRLSLLASQDYIARRGAPVSLHKLQAVVAP